MFSRTSFLTAVALVTVTISSSVFSMSTARRLNTTCSENFTKGLIRLKTSPRATKAVVGVLAVGGATALYKAVKGETKKETAIRATCITAAVAVGSAALAIAHNSDSQTSHALSLVNKVLTMAYDACKLPNDRSSTSSVESGAASL